MSLEDKRTERLNSTDDTDVITQEILQDKDYLLEIEMSPESGVRVFDIKYLLMLKHELTYNESDAELEEALNRMDVYLFSFKRGAEYWGSNLAQYEIKYEVWQKKKWKETEERLMAIELKKVEAGEITKSKVNVTKAHVDASMLEEYEEEYTKYQTILREKRSRLGFLKDITQLIESRGSRLQSIMSSRKGRQ